MKLAKQSQRPNLPWHFTIVDSPAVNAFALPGGFIYITRGILPYLDNEAQLAGVLEQLRQELKIAEPVTLGTVGAYLGASHGSTLSQD
jgi:predicted Zn-dependent protease